MKIGEILDRAKDATAATSDGDLSKHLGLSRTAVSNYRRGVSLPDTVTCERLAGITGIPLARVLGIVGEARAISREEKAVWRKLAATAGVLLVLIGGAFPARAVVLELSQHYVINPQSASYVKSQGWSDQPVLHFVSSPRII